MSFIICVSVFVYDDKDFVECIRDMKLKIEGKIIFF